MAYETGSPAGLKEIRNAHNILVGKTEGTRPLGGPRVLLFRIREIPGSNLGPENGYPD
jgi:hypothetical protein